MTDTTRIRYTYSRRFAAHYGDRIVTVPDQVAEDQRGFANAERTFPAELPSGRRVRVRIDAEATGLGTGGTGDLVVKSA